MSSYKEVEGNLKEVEGESPNPFYHTPKLKVPLRSPDANVKGISPKRTRIFEFDTEPGKVYTFNMLSLF